MQVTHTLMRGTYLAHRWEGDSRVLPYHFPDGARGFFIEIGYDTQHGRAMVLRSFSSSGPLADYAQGVRLPKK